MELLDSLRFGRDHLLPDLRHPLPQKIDGRGLGDTKGRLPLVPISYADKLIGRMKVNLREDPCICSKAEDIRGRG